MRRDKYTKVVNPVAPQWVRYLHASCYVNLSFLVRFDENGKVNSLASMERNESKDGSFYVSSNVESNITEQEFNEALLKTLEFVTRRNYNIVISANIKTD